MPLIPIIQTHRELTNDGKRTMMNAFCAGRSISEIAKHYTLSRLTVEVALREALIGMSALVARPSATTAVNTSADSLTITDVKE